MESSKFLNDFGDVAGRVRNPAGVTVGNWADGKMNSRKKARDNHLFKFLGEDSARLERGTVAGGGWAGFFSLAVG